MSGVFMTFSGVRRAELRRTLCMFGCFFLVITSFWILKPLKKALFIAHYDAHGFTLVGAHLSAAQAELCAKLLGVLLAAIAALGFGTLSRRVRGHTLIALFCCLFIGCFSAFGAWLSHPSGATVWAFYAVGDLYATVMVAALFVSLHDVSTQESAKRTYGMVGLGAVLGGVVGSQLVSGFLDACSIHSWMLVCSALTLLTALLALGAREHAYDVRPEPSEPARQTPRARALARAALPPYLLSLATMVGLYEVVSSILDYQFTATIAYHLDGSAIGRQIGRAFVLMNATALALQLFVTAPLLRHRGVGAALLWLPCTALLASLGVLAFPVVPMATLIPALDSGVAYSVHQSARESLYVPLASDALYGAKAFIDVFVMRGAKAVGVLLSLAITGVVSDGSGVRWLSLLSVALIVPWMLCAVRAGKRCSSLTLGETSAVAV
jgi:AAA family ATP:ADP antiporter